VPVPLLLMLMLYWAPLLLMLLRVLPVTISSPGDLHPPSPAPHRLYPSPPPSPPRLVTPRPW